MSYCEYCEREGTHELHKIYHDRHYGFPLNDDDELFGRLVMEINQAGLSWETILKKEEAFRKAYSGFRLKAVAAYDDFEVERLLSDPGIIRNRLKINAAIYNARQIMEIQEKYGKFSQWLDDQGEKSITEWVKIFKQNFKFVGGEIVNEFLMSTGYLKGAHVEECPVYDAIIEAGPKWKRYENN